MIRNFEQRLVDAESDERRSTEVPRDRDSYRRFLAEQSEVATSEARVSLSKWAQDRHRRQDEDRVRNAVAELTEERPGA